MPPFLPVVWGSVSACCRGSCKLSVLVLRPETKAKLPVVPCRESQGDCPPRHCMGWHGLLGARSLPHEYGNVSKITDGLETIFSP